MSTTTAKDDTDDEKHALCRGLDIGFEFSHSMDEGSDKVNVENGAELDEVEEDAEKEDDSPRVAGHDRLEIEQTSGRLWESRWSFWNSKTGPSLDTT
jgi:hypothetical protein